MKSKLRVMVVEPDKEPYEKFLKDSLEAMYEIVGKPIEVTRDILLPGMLLVVNEEGKLRGLPINRCTGMISSAARSLYVRTARTISEASPMRMLRK